MTPRAKKRWFDVLRLALCVGALWIVIQGVTIHDHVHLADGRADVVGRIVDDGDPLVVALPSGETVRIAHAELARDETGGVKLSFGLASAWRNSRKGLLLLAVLIHFPVIVPQAYRFLILLRAQQIMISYWECLKLTFAGNFLNFATPLGSNAGDVFKAYFLSLHTDQKTEAVTTVFLDRVVGLAALLLVVAALTVFAPGDSALSLFRPYMIGVLGAGVLGVALYFAPPVRRLLIPRLLRGPSRIVQHLVRIDNTAKALAARKRTVFAAILLTVLLQGVAVGAYFTVARALAMEAHAGNVLEYYAYFYTGVVVQALPGPPQGLGTVELTYRYFLSNYGSPSQIVCMAFGIRMVGLLCALPGLLVTLTGSYKPRETAEFVSAAGAVDSSGTLRS